jgi:hypothetical protein
LRPTEPHSSPARFWLPTAASPLAEGSAVSGRQTA